MFIFPLLLSAFLFLPPTFAFNKLQCSQINCNSPDPHRILKRFEPIYLGVEHAVSWAKCEKNSELFKALYYGGQQHPLSHQQQPLSSKNRWCALDQYMACNGRKKAYSCVALVVESLKDLARKRYGYRSDRFFHLVDRRTKWEVFSYYQLMSGLDWNVWIGWIYGDDNLFHALFVVVLFKIN